MEYHIVLVGTQMVIELISTVTFTFKHTEFKKAMLLPSVVAVIVALLIAFYTSGHFTIKSLSNIFV